MVSNNNNNNNNNTNTILDYNGSNLIFQISTNMFVITYL